MTKVHAKSKANVRAACQADRHALRADCRVPTAEPLTRSPTSELTFRPTLSVTSQEGSAFNVSCHHKMFRALSSYQLLFQSSDASWCGVS